MEYSFTPPARLSKTVASIQDLLRKDPSVDGDAQRLSQFAWMLFFRVYDIVSGSGLPDHLRWKTLTVPSSRNDYKDNIIGYVNERLIPGLRSLALNNPKHKLISEAFKDIQNFVSSGDILSEMAKRLETEIPLETDSDRSLLADIYEQMLSNLQSAGNAGEYYTPLTLARFITGLINPLPGERIMDFACGTGGFLVSALSHMLQNNPSLNKKNNQHKLKILGVEKKPLPHLLTVTNLLLHGIESPNSIIRGNLLDRPVDSFKSDELVDVILTNPPFGGLEEEKVYPNFPSVYKSRDTADLFVYLMIKLLKENGRAGIVLPDGFLFAAGVRARLRKLLLTECSIDALIRLPRGVFNPYTTIATNVLIISKGIKKDYIRYYQVPPPEGKTGFSKTSSLTKELLDPVTKWFFDDNEDKHAWRVSVESISRKDFNLDQKKPNQKLYSLKDIKNIQDLLLETQKKSDINQKKILKVLSANVEKKFESIFGSGFNIMCSSKEGINELLQIVYELAVAGKLTSKDLRISTVKKESLVQNLNLPGIEKPESVDQDEDYLRWRAAIPAHWSVARLSEVAEVVGGSTPDSGDESCFTNDGGIPWVTPADLYDLNGKFIKRGKRNLTEKGFQSCSVKLLPKDSILFSTRAPIGYVAISSNPITTNQGFKSLIPSRFISSEYLYYFLCAEKRRLEAAASGTVFKEIPARNMKAIWIPLPPLREQMEIVTMLNDLVPLLTGLSSLYSESLNYKNQFTITLSGAILANLFETIPTV